MTDGGPGRAGGGEELGGDLVIEDVEVINNRTKSGVILVTDSSGTRISRSLTALARGASSRPFRRCALRFSRELPGAA